MVSTSGLARRLGLVLVALAAALNVLPRTLDAHCRTTGAETGHQHHHPAKDIDGGGQCPHCPPVECRRHTDCGVAADWTVTAPVAERPLPVPAVVLAGFDQARATRQEQPPTPPPQGIPIVR